MRCDMSGCLVSEYYLTTKRFDWPVRKHLRKLERDQNRPRIVYSQHGLLFKPFFVRFANLLDLFITRFYRPERVEQDQDHGLFPDNFITFEFPELTRSGQDR